MHTHNTHPYNTHTIVLQFLSVSKWYISVELQNFFLHCLSTTQPARNDGIVMISNYYLRHKSGEGPLYDAYNSVIRHCSVLRELARGEQEYRIRWTEIQHRSMRLIITQVTILNPQKSWACCFFLWTTENLQGGSIFKSLVILHCALKPIQKPGVLGELHQGCWTPPIQIQIITQK